VSRDPLPSDASIDAIVDSIRADRRIRHLEPTFLPDQATVVRLVGEFHDLVFPGYGDRRNLTDATLPDHVREIATTLASDLRIQIALSLRYAHALEATRRGERPDPAGMPETWNEARCGAEARRITLAFMDRIPEIRRLISLDVQAAFDGDPAALHADEIIFCYPGLRATFIHRLAHELHRLDVPLLPRMMSEYAHAETGIDIHPGATIGPSFFIDHGTGVVIGATVEIGRHCKIYQGVTLGAKSFAKDLGGRTLRNLKRHPTLGNRVTVYASATILGGDTVIGDDCIVSGGVFLARSVPFGHIVRARPPELILRTNPEIRDFEYDGSGI